MAWDASGSRPLCRSVGACFPGGLATFTVSLRQGDSAVAAGSGKNSLRSPALCLAELASALERRGAPPLGPGALISSGTLTESQPIHAGEQWSVEIDGLGIEPLHLVMS